jgi:hypothetical protein
MSAELSALKALASGCTIAMFLSSAPAIHTIHQSHDTGEVALFPLVGLWLNCHMAYVCTAVLSFALPLGLTGPMLLFAGCCTASRRPTTSPSSRSSPSGRTCNALHRRVLPVDDSSPVRCKVNRCRLRRHCYRHDVHGAQAPPSPSACAWRGQRLMPFGRATG